jgi:hypothetical protein
MVNATAVSDSSTTSYPSSPRNGNEVTTQLLLDLLANSIAIMNIDDDHIDDWTQQLHDRIIHFRHGN